MGKTVTPKTEYEITLILKPDVTQGDVEDEDDRVRRMFIVRTHNTNPTYFLPYPTQGFECAYRMEYEVVERTENLEVKLFTHLLDNDDNVLRYMIIKKREK